MQFRFASLAATTAVLALVACSGGEPTPPPATTEDTGSGEDTSIAVDTGSEEDTGTAPDDTGTAVDSTIGDTGATETSSETGADAVVDVMKEVSTTCTSPGATEEEDCGKCGKRSRLCNSDKTWLPWGLCTGETGACVPKETRMATCGKCGKRTETCSAMCAWEGSACTGEGLCNAGDTETQYGACSNPKYIKVRTCSSTTCAWGEFSGCVPPKGWIDMAPAPTTFYGRHYHSSVWTGTDMIVWGGQSSFSSYANDGAAYNLSSDSWRILPVAPITGRYHHTAVWTGTQMIVWGGYGSYVSSSYYRSDGAVYDAASNSWTTLAASPLSARSQHTAVWTGTEVIIWGGYSGSYYADGAAYNPSTRMWRPLRAAPLSARYGHTAVWAGNKMIIVGGRGTGCTSGCADAAAYDPATDNWTVLSPPSTDLDARYDATGAVDPTKKLAAFWGGYGSSSVSFSYFRATGAYFDTATSTWKSIPAPSETVLPYSRRQHVTSWWAPDGFYVWGGNGYNASGSYSSSLNSGAVFDPATNNWKAMSDSNPLSGRYQAPAVWTGAEAIIWGGYSYRNDGKIYRP